MLRKQTARLRACLKIHFCHLHAPLCLKLASLSIITILSIPGCSGAPKTPKADSPVAEEKTIPPDPKEDGMADICLDLYEKAAEENRTDDLETVRGIVNRFGKYGYSAVDCKNQINMTHAGQAEEFCTVAGAGEQAEITIIEVGYQGDFIKYDLQAKDGKLSVVRSYYAYETASIQKKTVESNEAKRWSYTEEGYLMFSGIWYSEELYVLTMSGAEEYTALRVRPLDEACRELNRRYLLPVGFEQNNMFLVNWSEEDFGELNFYDMYDILYRNIHGEYVPYAADDNLGVGAVYRIPQEEFERVIMMYFQIDRETLQSKTVYHPGDSTYEYKPRGFEEVEYPEHPYSEVTGFTENKDGTVTLMANVVFPYAGTANVYSHEVVVRPLEDGGVQYVSNQVGSSADSSEKTWHTPRLTAEQWEELYGGG